MHLRFTRFASGLLVMLAFLFMVTIAYPFSTPTHSALSIVACRDHPQSQVDSVLKEQLGETNGLETMSLVDDDPGVLPGGSSRRTYSYLTALSLGAIDEDSEHGETYLTKKLDTATRHRMVNHFYDPSRNGMGFNDPEILARVEGWGGLKLPATDSLHWAWNNDGAIATLRGDENFGWRSARREYALWLKSQSSVDRMWHGGETFFALGHVLHLLHTDQMLKSHTL